ncbi:putative hemerythrin [Blattamonas nauphoetae]|uniref:Hemerythrin n=1 Tax=Blattamonas nauphoetae TaxID=2049346 RepID=A0ABQ9YAD5_9EUKA|nr:putative hemerythrin [Blattamonas nauphoetae]
MLVSVVLFNQDQELQAPPLILTEKIHHFHNLAFINEEKTISSLQVPTILGMHMDTSMLFELHNSTVKVWHVVVLIDMEYGIADLQAHSSFELQMSTIRFESENTPFCADTGTVTLSSVTIEGSSPIPQLFQSSEHGSSLNVIGCSVSDVCVGAQAILSADRTTVKITNSHFSHIEHIVQESSPESSIPESPTNTEEYPLESFTTVFMTSTIANVTDDLYGTITSAPMRGESFMFSGLTCTQQILRPHSLLSSPSQVRNTEQIAQSDIEIRDCKFENGSDIHKSGLSGLFLTVTGSRKVNITNCAFFALESPSGVSGLHIDASMSLSGQSPQISISKCSFTNCVGRTTTKLDLIHTAASLWACEWTNSSSKDGVLRVRGSGPKMWTGPGLILGRCAFTDCTSQSDPESKSGCVDVVYDGPISLANQTTVENCVGDSAAAIVVGSIVSVECSRFVHSASKSTFISAGYICGWQVSLKNVLISKCASCDARHSLVLSLFWKPSLTEMEDAPIESNYSAENVFVKRGKNKVGMEILYSVPEALLLDERLNPTQFKKVHSDSKIGTVASTTTKVDPLDSHALDIQDVEFTDETLEVSSKGRDPREDKTRGKNGNNEGTNTGAIIAISINIPVDTLVVVGLIILKIQSAVKSLQMENGQLRKYSLRDKVFLVHVARSDPCIVHAMSIESSQKLFAFLHVYGKNMVTVPFFVTVLIVIAISIQLFFLPLRQPDLDSLYFPLIMKNIGKYLDLSFSSSTEEWFISVFLVVLVVVVADVALLVIVHFISSTETKVHRYFFRLLRVNLILMCIVFLHPIIIILSRPIVCAIFPSEKDYNVCPEHGNVLYLVFGILGLVIHFCHTCLNNFFIFDIRFRQSSFLTSRTGYFKTFTLALSMIWTIVVSILVLYKPLITSIIHCVLYFLFAFGVIYSVPMFSIQGNSILFGLFAQSSFGGLLGIFLPYFNTWAASSSAVVPLVVFFLIAAVGSALIWISACLWMRPLFTRKFLVKRIIIKNTDPPEQQPELFAPKQPRTRTVGFQFSAQGKQYVYRLDQPILTVAGTGPPNISRQKSFRANFPSGSTPFVRSGTISQTIEPDRQLSRIKSSLSVSRLSSPRLRTESDGSCQEMESITPRELTPRKTSDIHDPPSMRPKRKRKHDKDDQSKTELMKKEAQSPPPKLDETPPLQDLEQTTEEDVVLLMEVPKDQETYDVTQNENSFSLPEDTATDVEDKTDDTVDEGTISSPTETNTSNTTDHTDTQGKRNSGQDSDQDLLNPSSSAPSPNAIHHAPLNLEPLDATKLEPPHGQLGDIDVPSGLTVSDISSTGQTTIFSLPQLADQNDEIGATPIHPIGLSVQHYDPVLVPLAIPQPQPVEIIFEAPSTSQPSALAVTTPTQQSTHAPFLKERQPSFISSPNMLAVDQNTVILNKQTLQDAINVIAKNYQKVSQVDPAIRFLQDPVLARDPFAISFVDNFFRTLLKKERFKASASLRITYALFLFEFVHSHSRMMSFISAACDMFPSITDRWISFLLVKQIEMELANQRHGVRSNKGIGSSTNESDIGNRKVSEQEAITLLISGSDSDGGSSALPHIYTSQQQLKTADKHYQNALGHMQMMWLLLSRQSVDCGRVQQHAMKILCNEQEAKKIFSSLLESNPTPSVLRQYALLVQNVSFDEAFASVLFTEADRIEDENMEDELQRMVLEEKLKDRMNEEEDKVLLAFETDLSVSHQPLSKSQANSTQQRHNRRTIQKNYKALLARYQPKEKLPKWNMVHLPLQLIGLVSVAIVILIAFLDVRRRFSNAISASDAQRHAVQATYIGNWLTREILTIGHIVGNLHYPPTTPLDVAYVIEMNRVLVESISGYFVFNQHFQDTYDHLKEDQEFYSNTSVWVIPIVDLSFNLNELQTIKLPLKQLFYWSIEHSIELTDDYMAVFRPEPFYQQVMAEYLINMPLTLTEELKGLVIRSTNILVNESTTAAWLQMICLVLSTILLIIFSALPVFVAIALLNKQRTEEVRKLCTIPKSTAERISEMFEKRGSGSTVNRGTISSTSDDDSREDMQSAESDNNSSDSTPMQFRKMKSFATANVGIFSPMVRSYPSLVPESPQVQQFQNQPCTLCKDVENAVDEEDEEHKETDSYDEEMDEIELQRSLDIEEKLKHLPSVVPASIWIRMSLGLIVITLSTYSFFIIAFVSMRMSPLLSIQIVMNAYRSVYTQQISFLSIVSMSPPTLFNHAGNDSLVFKPAKSYTTPVFKSSLYAYDIDELTDNIQKLCELFLLHHRLFLSGSGEDTLTGDSFFDSISVKGIRGTNAAIDAISTDDTKCLLSAEECETHVIPGMYGTYHGLNEFVTRYIELASSLTYRDRSLINYFGNETQFLLIASNEDMQRGYDDITTILTDQLSTFASSSTTILIVVFIIVAVILISFSFACFYSLPSEINTISKNLKHLPHLLKTTQGTQIKWTDEMSTSIPRLDVPHQATIELLSTLLSSVLSNAPTEEIRKTLVSLCKITFIQFADEEKLMEESETPEAMTTAHTHAHTNLLRKLINFTEISQKHRPSIESVSEFCSTWILEHYSVTDSEFGLYLTQLENQSQFTQIPNLEVLQIPPSAVSFYCQGTVNMEERRKFERVVKRIKHLRNS